MWTSFYFFYFERFPKFDFSVVVDINFSHERKHLPLRRIAAVSSEYRRELSGADVTILVLQMWEDVKGVP